MKRFDPTAWLLTTVVSFCIFLLLSTYGPLSNNNTLGHNAIISLAIALIGGAYVGWSAKRSDSRSPRVLELDDATSARVDDLLASGKKVEAVKVVRQTTRADLQTAVDTVNSRTTA